jgi:hypothetical protein
MTATKVVEYRIIRQLLQRREESDRPLAFNPWAERLIAILALTAGLFVLGSYLEELLWVVLATALLLTLR